MTKVGIINQNRITYQNTHYTCVIDKDHLMSGRMDVPCLRYLSQYPPTYLFTSPATRLEICHLSNTQRQGFPVHLPFTRLIR